MARISLHGMIPVYVLIDTDKNEVVKVCASDEEFVYVGDRHSPKDENNNEQLTSMRAIYTNELPIAYTESGDRFADEQLIAEALSIAETSAAGWPAWDWGW